MFCQRREELTDCRFQCRQSPREQAAAEGDGDLGGGKGARRMLNALRPARSQYAAERNTQHESGEHQRPRPNGIAEHATERAKPEHFEQQRRGARGEKGERQPHRFSDQRLGHLAERAP
jgi:hypothetical protein